MFASKYVYLSLSGTHFGWSPGPHTASNIYRSAKLRIPNRWMSAVTAETNLGRSLIRRLTKRADKDVYET